MPRDASGVFDYDFVFVDDATGTPKVPFDPARFDAKFADVKSGLNDIPRQAPPGSLPENYQVGSFMHEDGVIYMNVINGSSDRKIWQDISSPGITDASGFLTQETFDSAVEDVFGAVPETLDSLSEIAAAINNDPDFFNTINTQLGLKAAINHTHITSDVAGLDAALQALADSISLETSGLWVDYYQASLDIGDLTEGGGGGWPFSNENSVGVRVDMAEGSSTLDLGDLT